MTRKRAWQIAGAIWLFTAILLLSTCEPGPDIDILETDTDTEPPTMIVSAGKDVNIDLAYEWLSKECRDIMVLPPIHPEAVMVWQRLARSSERTEYKFKCTRP